MKDLKPEPEYPFRLTPSGKTAAKPKVGELIYVEDSGLPYAFGGLGVVTSISNRAYSVEFTVQEHGEGVHHNWREVGPRQKQLHALYRLRPARLPTAEELHTQQEIQRALNVRIAEHKEVRRKEVEAAEEAKRAPRTLNVLNRGLLDVPIWERNKRARNWAAVVTLDPLAPGGLSRYWLERGRGPSFYIVPEQLRVNDVLEFAADYVRHSGTKEPKRWYGIVTAIASDHLIVEPATKVTNALLKANDYRIQARVG